MSPINLIPLRRRATADGRPRGAAGLLQPDRPALGNPHYDWAAMRRDGYKWWCDRLAATLRNVDVVRFDHFRGFRGGLARCRPAARTAENGHWSRGRASTCSTPCEETRRPAADRGRPRRDHPGRGRTPRAHGPAGMRILQFAFGGKAEDRFLPIITTIIRSSTRARTTTTRPRLVQVARGTRARHHPPLPSAAAATTSRGT